MTKNINFVSNFKKANTASVIIFILSIFFIIFKASRIVEAFKDVSDRNSIKVPPLKSIP